MSLESDIEECKAKIVELQTNEVWSRDYKDRQMALQTAYLKNAELELVIMRKLLDERR